MKAALFISFFLYSYSFLYAEGTRFLNVHESDIGFSAQDAKTMLSISSLFGAKDARAALAPLSEKFLIKNYESKGIRYLLLEYINPNGFNLAGILVSDGDQSTLKDGRYRFVKLNAKELKLIFDVAALSVENQYSCDIAKLYSRLSVTDSIFYVFTYYDGHSRKSAYFKDIFLIKDANFDKLDVKEKKCMARSAFWARVLSDYFN